MRQRKDQRADIFVYNIVFALPLVLKEDAVAFFQMPDHTFRAFAMLSLIGFQQLFDCKKIFFIDRRTVHFPAPLHKIVRLVHQKNVVPARPLRKEALQIGIRVKDIIVIPYDVIRPGCRIQRHLKRADPVFPRLL